MVLPYTDLNLPWVYMCSPSWTTLPLPSPSHPSGSSQCTSAKHPISSVQFSRSVVSDSLWPHESQHTRPPCPSPTPGVHSDSCPSSQWCHPAISSSVIPFSSYPQSLPASESFPISQLFSWGGQSTGVSALASFLPKNTQGWPPSEWTGWMHFKMDWFLAVQGTLKSLLQHHSSKASILRHSAFFTVRLSHPYMTTGKTIALTRQTFVGKVMSLLFNMLSRLVITFLPRSKCLLISWLQSPSCSDFGAQKLKSDTVSTVSPSISHEVILLILFYEKGNKDFKRLKNFSSFPMPVMDRAGLLPWARLQSHVFTSGLQLY